MAESRSQIAEKIRSLRKQAGITQADLAAAIGVDAQTVARWERGERSPGAAAFENALVHLQSVLGGISRNVSRGTLRVSEPPPLQMPEWLGLRIEDTVLELARAGATNEQGRYIREILGSDATLRFVLRNDDGTPRRAAQQEDRIRDLIEGLHAWIERSAMIRAAENGTVGTINPPPTPGGAPIAPVVAVPEPGRQTVIDLRTKKK